VKTRSRHKVPAEEPRERSGVVSPSYLSCPQGEWLALPVGLGLVELAPLPRVRAVQVLAEPPQAEPPLPHSNWAASWQQASPPYPHSVLAAPSVVQ
jgi:hypothetical protein